MSLDREEWGTKAESEGNKNYNRLAYIDGAEYFQQKAIEDIMKLEDRLYDDHDQTTPKELLWQIRFIIENLKP